MAEGKKGQSEETPQQGNLLNELDTMYKKVSEEQPGEPGSLKDSPPGKDLEPDIQSGHTDRTSLSKKGSASLARFFLYSVPIVLIAAFALFIWPTPYQYGALKQGGRIYLVKTNRLTNAKSYFYAGKWMSAPLPDASGLRLPDPLSIKSPDDVPMQIPEPPSAATQKSPPPETAHKPEPSLTARNMPPAPASAPEPVREKAGTPVKEPAKAESKPEPKPQALVKEPAQARAEPPAKSTAAKRAEKKKPYAVQIRAFQSREEMKKFFADRSAEEGMHWARVKTAKGTWYRVFIGRFGNQEEAKGYIRKNRIEAAYPGSFVQKIN